VVEALALRKVQWSNNFNTKEQRIKGTKFVDEEKQSLFFKPFVPLSV
jgi:hypothetical protein